MKGTLAVDGSSRSHDGRIAFPNTMPDQLLNLLVGRLKVVFLCVVCVVWGLLVLQSVLLKTPFKGAPKIMTIRSQPPSLLLNESANATANSTTKDATPEPNRNITNSTYHVQLTNATKVSTVTGGNIRNWCSGRWNNSGNFTKEIYFLTVVVFVRIYNADVSQLSTREFVQWLQYLSYAGVEHVYVYDSYLIKNESQEENLSCFVESGFVTYVNWSYRASPDAGYTQRLQAAQQPAYKDCHKKYGHEFAWQASIDIDEYPFCPGDLAPGFLPRVIKKIIGGQKGKLGLIFMQNYLFLGKPLNDSQHPLLIDRLWRRTVKPWSAQTVKPIYLSKALKTPMVHRPHIHKGFVSFYPKYNILRLNHYHGERHKAKTVEDRGMMRVVSALQPCHEKCPQGCC